MFPEQVFTVMQWIGSGSQLPGSAPLLTTESQRPSHTVRLLKDTLSSPIV